MVDKDSLTSCHRKNYNTGKWSMNADKSKTMKEIKKSTASTEHCFTLKLNNSIITSVYLSGDVIFGKTFPLENRKNK